MKKSYLNLIIFSFVFFTWNGLIAIGYEGDQLQSNEITRNNLDKEALVREYINNRGPQYLRNTLGENENVNYSFDVSIHNTNNQIKFYLYLKDNDTSIYQVSFIFEDNNRVYRDDLKKLSNSSNLKAKVLIRFFHQMMDDLNVNEVYLTLMPMPAQGQGEPIPYNGKINWETGYDFMWDNRSLYSLYPVIKTFFSKICKIPSNDHSGLTTELIKDTRLIYYLINNTYDIYKKFGSPRNPTKMEVKMIRKRNAPDRSVGNLGLAERGSENNTCWRTKIVGR